jgi:hypothetical protein
MHVPPFSVPVAKSRHPAADLRFYLILNMSNGVAPAQETADSLEPDIDGALPVSLPSNRKFFWERKIEQSFIGGQSERFKFLFCLGHSGILFARFGDPSQLIGGPAFYLLKSWPVGNYCNSITLNHDQGIPEAGSHRIQPLYRLTSLRILQSEKTFFPIAQDGRPFFSHGRADKQAGSTAQHARTLTPEGRPAAAAFQCVLRLEDDDVHADVVDRLEPARADEAQRLGIKRPVPIPPANPLSLTFAAAVLIAAALTLNRRDA